MKITAYVLNGWLHTYKTFFNVSHLFIIVKNVCIYSADPFMISIGMIRNNM